MTPQDFENLLAFLEETPEMIRSLAKNLTGRELSRKTAKEEFSFLEHVCHLRDIEHEGYRIRIVKLLSEEQPFLPDIDGDKLAKERNYNSQSFAEALSAFTRARKNNIDTIRTTTPAGLMRTATFEAAGTITLEQLLLMMREHDEAHRRSLMARHLVQPTFRTERLVLRPFEENDAQRLLQIAGEHRIADTMISVPYPYALEQAHDSIHQYREEFQSAAAVHFAVALTESPQAFMGYVAIKHIDQEHAEGELSFWIDWRASGHGYITEAARAAVKYAFDEMNLNRICAYHMVRNPASGRVLAKLGFRQEGLLRQRVRKWSIFEDVLIYALLRSDLG